MNLQHALDEIEWIADAAWHGMTSDSGREMRSQSRLAVGYVLAAAALICIAWEHGRRAHGATRGRWTAGSWS